jgi:hypothetical protein
MTAITFKIIQNWFTIFSSLSFEQVWTKVKKEKMFLDPLDVKCLLLTQTLNCQNSHFKFSGMREREVVIGDAAQMHKKYSIRF